MAAKKEELPPVAEEVVIATKEPVGYDLDRIFNATGSTKHPTLNEVNARNLMQKQGLEPQSSSRDARQFVRYMLNRAGLMGSPLQPALEEMFTEVLNQYVVDPAEWQNSNGTRGYAEG